MTFSRIATVSQRRWVIVLLVFLVTLIAYARTVLPGVNGGDVGELQYAGKILALTHPTGYPLYVLLGFVWTRIVPIGSVAYRMNLLSATSGAVGVAVLAWMVHRVYGNAIIALVSGLTLGFGSTFWQIVVVGDKYAFNIIFVSLVVGLALWWAEEREQAHGDKLLYALSLVYGISLLHHRTMVLFGPGLAFLVLYKEHSNLIRRRRRTLINLGLVFLPALIVYPIFLPLVRSRSLSLINWQPTDMRDWINWLVERNIASGAFVAEGFIGKLEEYRVRLLDSYPASVLLVAIFGLIMLAINQPASAILLASGFALQAGLGANYRNNYRPYVFFSPSYVIMIFAYAYGLKTIWKALKVYVLQARPQWKPASGVLLGVALLAIPAAQFVSTYPLRRSDAVYGKPLDIWRNELYTADMGARLASGMQDVPQNAVIIGDWEQATVLWYYQKVENIRPDIEIVYPVERLAEYEATNRDVCVARNVPIAEFWHPGNVDALVCLQRKPGFTLPERATVVGTELYTADGSPELELAGYWVDDDIYEAGRFAPLVLSWRALTEIDEDYSVSLQILDEEWNVLWSQDIAAPVMGMYPTSRWTSGEVVQDYHEFDIPREMPPGRYLWVVEMYRQLEDGSFEQLRDAEGNIKILGSTFEVIPG